MQFSRRTFLKLGAAACAASLLPGGIARAAEEPDLVAVANGSPAEMFAKGIERLGGMSRFVKKGQKVLVKPNIGWDRKPEEGANTSPDLVGAIVKAALVAGAASVRVFDNTCNNYKDCYASSGIERAVTENGGIMETGNDKKRYRKVTIADAKILKEAEAHELFLDSDVFINVPILKHHAATQMTCALKNLMGVIYDRRFWHRSGLHECISEFGGVRKADLVVVDAWNVMTRNGPRGGSVADVTNRKMQILGIDPVACDAAAAKILDREPSSIDYIPFAAARGLGTDALDKLNIARIAI